MILESLLFFMWNSSFSIRSQHVRKSYRVILLLLLLISFQTSFWLTMIHFICISYDFNSISTTSRFCSSMKVVIVTLILFSSVSIFFWSWNSKWSFKRSLFFSEQWLTYSLMSRRNTDVNCYDPSYAPSLVAMLVAMLMAMLMAILRAIADRSPLGHRLVPKPTLFRVSLCSPESYR